MNLQTDIVWPATLPLPKVDYSGSPKNATIVSPPESAVIIRRSRFTRCYSVLSVAWVFTDAEFQIFKAFYADDLGNGTAQFKIELRFSKDSILTEWSARFEEGYQATYEDGNWNVQASLDLVNPVVI